MRQFDFLSLWDKQSAVPAVLHFPRRRIDVYFRALLLRITTKNDAIMRNCYVSQECGFSMVTGDHAPVIVTIYRLLRVGHQTQQ